MPNNDRTGPNGMGSQTGRGAGLCNASGNSVSYNSQKGQRLGRRQGLGRCQGGQRTERWQFRGIRQLNDSSTSSELGLQQQIQDLQKQLDTLSEALIK